MEQTDHFRARNFDATDDNICRLVHEDWIPRWHEQIRLKHKQAETMTKVGVDDEEWIARLRSECSEMAGNIAAARERLRNAQEIL